MGSEVDTFTCDIAADAQIQAVVRAAVRRFGRRDAALNQTGVAGDHPVPVNVLTTQALMHVVKIDLAVGTDQ